MEKTFHYFKEPPQNWEDSLHTAKKAGVTILDVPCLWGIHESTPGMRDFTRSPKLRLEKIFSLAKSQGLQVHLSLGFTPQKAAFPNWAFGSKVTGATPAVFWNEHDFGYQFQKIPSFVNPEFQRAFSEFLEEALNLAELYKGPEGPISKITIDMGILASDILLTKTQEYWSLFQKKYQSVDELNDRFQTTLRSLNSQNPEALFRSLYDKRPWVAAHDYRTFRRELLNDFCAALQSLDVVQRLGSKVKVGTSAPSPKTDNPALLIDSTFLDTYESTIAPFFPQMAVHSLSAYAYRISEFFLNSTQKSGFQFLKVSEEALDENLSFPFSVVICGKHLTSASVQSIEALAKNGTPVFFPFGFPLYNETLKEIAWSKLGEREILKNTKRPLIRVPLKVGSLYSPVGTVAIEPGLWDIIRDYQKIVLEADSKSLKA